MDQVKEEVVKYEILKPICQGCENEIDTPAETDMELFRIGIIAHRTCLKIYSNITEMVERYAGIEVEIGG